MSDAKPLRERTLDDFADDILTYQRPRDDGSWHAVLDCGFLRQVSDPDFSTHGYGATREQAASRAAAAIRADARGIGKFAPHRLLVDSYDLNYRLKPHWAAKERLVALGIDPSEAMRTAKGVDLDAWKLKGSYLDIVDENRLLEFEFGIVAAETKALVEAGDMEPDDAAARMGERMREFVETRMLRRSRNAETLAEIDRRAGEMAAGMATPRP